jgi:hypothetical protein
MGKNEDKRKIILQAVVLITVIVIAIAGLWVVAEQLEKSSEVEEPESPISASLRIIGDGWQVEYMNVQTKNNTVFKLLMECSVESNFSIGSTHWGAYDSVFINSINGTHNGEHNKWWQYYVNDVYGDVGCDRKEIFDGDLVEWKFEEPGQ